MANLALPDITSSLLNAQVAQQKRLATAESVVPQADRTKLRTKANEFESFYIYQTMELMAPQTDPDSVFSGGQGEEMFRHNLNEEMAKNITAKGGFGISNIVYKELVTQQENLVTSRNAAAATATAYSATAKAR